MDLYLLIFILISAIQNGHSLLESTDKELVQEFRDFLGTKQNELKNEEERNFLNEFLQKTPDDILNNWIQNTDGNFEKSRSQLLKSLEWRRENDVDNIEDWQAACGFNSGEFPYRVNGFTDEGYPVLYGQLGLWDGRKAIFNGHRADFLKEYTRMLEGAYKAMNSDSKFNDTIGQWITIYDMAGITIRQISSVRTLAAIREMLRIRETNYPLHTKHVFFINVPPFFITVLQTIQNTISPRGFGDFKFFSTNKNEWYPMLENVIPAKAIPEELL